MVTMSTLERLESAAKQAVEEADRAFNSPKAQRDPMLRAILAKQCDEARLALMAARGLRTAKSEEIGLEITRSFQRGF